MFKFLKYFPALMVLKDVTDAYEQEKGGQKPFYMKKRVVGSSITAASVVASIAYGLEIDKTSVNQFIDYYNTIADTLFQIQTLITTSMLPALTAMYGILMAVKGQIDVKMRKAIGDGKKAE
jgi:hypothetical protein